MTVSSNFSDAANTTGCANVELANRVQQLSGWSIAEIDALLTENQIPGKIMIADDCFNSLLGYKWVFGVIYPQ